MPHSFLVTLVIGRNKLTKFYVHLDGSARFVAPEYVGVFPFNDGGVTRSSGMQMESTSKSPATRYST